MGFMSSHLITNLIIRLVEGGNDELGLAKMVVTLLPGDEGYVIALAQVVNPLHLFISSRLTLQSSDQELMM